MAEHDRLACPKSLGGSLLLCGPPGDQLVQGHSFVPGPFGSVRDDQHGYLTSGIGPGSQRSAGTKLSIIRMGADRQSPVGYTLRLPGGLSVRIEPRLHSRGSLLRGCREQP